ncbi:hypothetical protein WJX77_004071 [Trebouxia sp. C0004]
MQGIGLGLDAAVVDPAQSVDSPASAAAADADAVSNVTTRHFQRLSLAFVYSAGVVLRVHDGDMTVDLPAHSVVLSGHSPVLSDLLQSIRARQPDAEQQVTACSSKLPVPMVGDSLHEVQALLDAIYLPFAATAALGDPAALWGIQPADPYGALPLAHKYGMVKLTADLESELVSKVQAACATERSLWPGDVGYGASSISVLGARVATAYAAAAETCHLTRLLAHSEAYIVRHFHEVDFGDPEVGQRLSRQSFFRIARGLAGSYAPDLQSMSAALSKSAAETETALVQARHVIKLLQAHWYKEWQHAECDGRGII